MNQTMAANSITNWMSWEGGVDLVGMIPTDSPRVPEMPNVIVHVARMVHTPVGSSPAGMILFAPHDGPPELIGFIAADKKVGEFFGPKIFAGTPFEQAPVHEASIDIDTGDDYAAATVVVGNKTFKTRLSGLGESELVNRPPTAMAPFMSQGVEAAARNAEFSVNGESYEIQIAPQGPTGGAGAVWAPCGVYAR